VKKQFAMRYDTLLNGIEIVGEDLDFLCSLSEEPSEDYKIPDAVAYSAAVMAVMNQLAYMSQEIINNKLTDDGEHIILTKEEVDRMNFLSDEVEESLTGLRECGISIKVN
jgi:hypothetical protein|tara:strand:+ start:239 stop:568 length:330 start_codon:yes stop_codon:yes gene_type:complete